MRYRLAAGVAALCAVVLAGCTGLPDRDAQVERLEAEISAMPGVQDYWATYTNDFTTGSNLTLYVRMPAASDAQIAAVATRINEVKQDDFDGYNQTTEFKIGVRVNLELPGELNADRVAELTRRLRPIGATIPTSVIEWRYDELVLSNAPEVAASLAAVRTGLGDERVPVTVLTDGSGPRWTVDFPFSSRQEQVVRGQLAESPADVVAVGIEKGRISSLSVEVRHPRGAYHDLRALIETVRPTRSHPMRLEWEWPGSEGSARRFSGQVDVAGCRYGNTAGEQDPGRYYTPGAIDLQRRLRDEFDACAR